MAFEGINQKSHSPPQATKNFGGFRKIWHRKLQNRTRAGCTRQLELGGELDAETEASTEAKGGRQRKRESDFFALAA